MSKELCLIVVPNGLNRNIQISVSDDGIVVVENAHQVCAVRHDGLRSHGGYTLDSRTFVTTTMSGSEVSTKISRSHGPFSGGTGHPEMRMWFPPASQREGQIEISYSHMPASIPLYPAEEKVGAAHG